MSSDDQEDVSSPYEAGPLRPLGPLRGRENWYTRDHIKALQRADLSAHFTRVRLLTYWEDRSSKAEQEVGKSSPKFEMENGIP